MRILRVFPRKTSMTPEDDLAFIGEPPLLRPEADEVHVSVTFTWDIDEGGRLREAWSNHYSVVKIGGPAFDDPGAEFMPGRYMKPGVTITSRGCPRCCPWCFVPKREGGIRLLPIEDGWIVQDNNLLATPREHQEAVYAMLKRQRRGADFRGGLDARLVDDWVTEQLRDLRINSVFLAADADRALPALRSAAKRLGFLSRNKLRCYVMIGMGETLEQAEARLEAVWDTGCLPFSQLYQPPHEVREYSREWKQLNRNWSRPAITKAMHKTH